MKHAPFWATTGFAALGGAVGWLSGWSGPDSQVLAAMLPAILSVVGGVIGAFAFREPEVAQRMRHLQLGGIALLVFSVSLGAGAYLGSLARSEAQERSYLKAQKVKATEEKNKRQGRLEWQKFALELYQKRLQACAVTEVLINDSRQMLDLPKLGPQEICPPHLIRIRIDRHP